jgi:hypothetical protein
VKLDGFIMPDANIALVNDQKEHTLEINIPLVSEEL